MIRPRARRYHGGLAALYVLGMLVTVGHLALEDHHSVLAHHHHHDHTATAESHDVPCQHHAPGLASFEHATCQHTCCHLTHDTLPSQRPRTLQARAPRLSGLVLALPCAEHGRPIPATLRRTLDTDSSPDPLAGIMSVAAGRAPPCTLHA